MFDLPDVGVTERVTAAVAEKLVVRLDHGPAEVEALTHALRGEGGSECLRARERGTGNACVGREEGVGEEIGR